MKKGRTYENDQDKVIYIQNTIAIPKIYSKAWPGSIIESVDGRHQDELCRRFDFSGIDKIVFLSQGGFYI